MLEVGSTVKICNNVGTLKIKILSTLSIIDISTANDKDSLPSMNKPRVELHYNKTDNKLLITVMDNHQNLPIDVYVCEVDLWNPLTAQWYLGKIEESEVEPDYFQTII